MKKYTFIWYALQMLVLSLMGDTQPLYAARTGSRPTLILGYTVGAGAGVITAAFAGQQAWKAGSGLQQKKYAIGAAVALLGAGVCVGLAWKQSYDEKRGQESGKQGSQKNDEKERKGAATGTETVASLFQAIRAGNLQEANALLSQYPQAAKGRENKTDKTTLIAAIQSSEPPEAERVGFITTLITLGVDVNYQASREGGCLTESALMRALERGCYDIAQVLINQGKAKCDVTYGSQQERLTAFYALSRVERNWFKVTGVDQVRQARIEGFCKSFIALVEHGADPNAIMGLALAKHDGRALFPKNTIFNILCSYRAIYDNIPHEIIDLFVNYCDVRVSSDDCPPSLVVAAFHGNAPLVKRICDQYKKIVQGVRWQSKTPLDYCTMGATIFAERNEYLLSLYAATKQYLEELDNVQTSSDDEEADEEEDDEES